MNRNIIDPALITAIGKKVVTYYEAVDITIKLNGTNTIYNLSNAPRAFVDNGTTYNSFGQLLDFDAVDENVSFEVSTMTISLSGLDPYEPNTGDPLLEVILRESTSYIGLPVQVKRVYFENGVNIGSIELFKGYITTANALHNDTTSTTIGIECASHWIDFQTTRGRKTNNHSQQYHFPNDLGFYYSSSTIKDIEWKPA